MDSSEDERDEPKVAAQLLAKIQKLEDNLAKLSMGSSIELPKPERYDGKSSFKDYIRSFNKYVSANGWQPSRCCQVLPLFLVSEARAVYDRLDLDQRNTWEALLTNLGKKLTQQNTKEVARSELAIRKQGKTESISEFALAVKDLVERAFPDSDLCKQRALGDPEPTDAEKREENARIQRFRSELARDHFMNGLIPEIKKKLLYAGRKPDSGGDGEFGQDDRWNPAISPPRHHR